MITAVGGGAGRLSVIHFGGERSFFEVAVGVCGGLGLGLSRAWGRAGGLRQRRRLGGR